MHSPKLPFPDEYGSHNLPVTSLAESFPFVIKECGYCQEKKFVLGRTNNYSEYLLMYSIEGSARYTKNTLTQYIQANSIITTACNTTLTFTRVTKEWKFFYFIISGSHAKMFYNLVRTHNNVILSNPFSPILSSFIDLYQILSDPLYEADKNETWKHLHSNVLLANIFTSLYDITFDVGKIKELTPAQETVVNTALKYIAENYKNQLDIETICNNVGFSKYYFCKIFKQQMGVTVHQYVNEFRINKAKELLAYSKLSVNSIANQVGFKTPLTFIRAFEKAVQMTPSEYRDYY